MIAGLSCCNVQVRCCSSPPRATSLLVTFRTPLVVPLRMNEQSRCARTDGLTDPVSRQSTRELLIQLVSCASLLFPSSSVSGRIRADPPATLVHSLSMILPRVALVAAHLATVSAQVFSCIGGSLYSTSLVRGGPH